MARVTVEDCIERIPNRFELVMSAAQRVRDINAGSQITVDRDRDKNPVVALREIADSTIDLNELKEGLVKRNQRISMAAEETEEQIDVIEGDEAAWASMAQEALESGNDMNFDDAEEEEMEEAAEFSAASAEAADDDAF